MNNTRSITDQTGSTLQLHSPAKRIVSLVPSQTELLADLDLNESVLGITKFCIHPQEWFRTKPRIGGTKNIRIGDILKLQPDLIIANKEENVQEQVEALAKYIPVYTSNISNLNDALEMIQHIGLLTGRSEASSQLKEKIEMQFSQLQFSVSISVVYLIWRDPWMSVGGDTFISNMLSKAGMRNLLEEQKRYPTISIQELQTLAPELILLSSEPYPFKEKHISELKQFLPDTEIVLADGQFFSWYGSRLQHAPSYFKSLRESLLLDHD